MSKTKKRVSSKELSEAIVKGMQEMKASDIIVINLTKTSSSVADYYVICTGKSDTHLDSIAREVEGYVFKSFEEKPKNIEGRTNKEWVLLDYFNVLVHIFKEEQREYYSLENLWGDAEMTKIESLD